MGLFPQGEPLSIPYFSGRAWLSMLVEDASPLHCPIGHVTFEPGCRNHWHAHPGGQILLVTAGRGFYQERGHAARALVPGDVVTIAAGVEHWHGAAPDAWFTHLAITANPERGPAQWLEAVTDHDYALATAARTR